MENASKALIIAGAILISILIISLGILVYNNSKDVASSDLSSEEAQTFNEKITQYCGNKKSASDMNALISAISASNGAQVNYASADQHYISVTVSNVSNDYMTGSSSVSVSASTTGSVSYPSFIDGLTYSASYTTDATTGYVDSVTITGTT